MRFSERIKKREIKSIVQLESMDDDLRNGLWNVLYMFFIERLQENVWLDQSYFKDDVEAIWFSFFKEPIDDIPKGTASVVNILKSRFFKWDYLEIYDFIDFFVGHNSEYIDKEEIIDSFNFILTRDLSGYRFINSQLSPIVNENEINEIEKAISTTSSNNLNSVNIHLSEALNKLSDRRNPDYRNSIKESISALESLCQKITKEPKAELGKALKILGGILPIHGALEQGFIKIYGYTSDSDGIRHAMMDEPNLDQEDALYMLIACSSFINYLITKSQKIGLTF